MGVPDSRRNARAYFDLAHALLQEHGAVRLMVRSSCMWPVVRDGDHVIVERVAPENVTVGDILAYRLDDLVRAHRVRRILREGTVITEFILRADEYRSDDPPVPPDRVLGRVAAVVRDGKRRPVGPKRHVLVWARALWHRLRRGRPPCELSLPDSDVTAEMSAEDSSRTPNRTR